MFLKPISIGEYILIGRDRREKLYTFTQEAHPKKELQKKVIEEIIVK